MICSLDFPRFLELWMLLFELLPSLICWSCLQIDLTSHIVKVFLTLKVFLPNASLIEFTTWLPAICNSMALVSKMSFWIVEILFNDGWKILRPWFYVHVLSWFILFGPISNFLLITRIKFRGILQTTPMVRGNSIQIDGFFTWSVCFGWNMQFNPQLTLRIGGNLVVSFQIQE